MDLKINKGEVSALVHGSSRKPYDVTIQIETLSEDKWRKVTDLCNHRIGSLDQLLEGKFPKELEELFTNHKYGFFQNLVKYILIVPVQTGHICVNMLQQCFMV